MMKGNTNGPTRLEGQPPSPMGVIRALTRRNWATKSQGRVKSKAIRPLMNGGHEPLEERQLLTTFFVKSVSDNPAVTETLRRAITQANANPGPDDIVFDIPGAGPYNIALASALPVITDAVTIDGYTAAGSSPNSAVNGSNATIMVRLSGSTGFSGLRFGAGSDNSLVRGLALNQFDNGILLQNTTGVAIEGNSIGAITANLTGILIDSTANGNTIGGGSRAAKNVVSNNTSDGIRVSGSNNLIQGNIVGLNPTGNAPLPNQAAGVNLRTGAVGNLVGGVVFGEGNVISGNAGDGVFVATSQTSNDVVDSMFTDSIPIPDEDFIESTIDVVGPGTLTDLNVIVDINHPFDPDLVITLVAPNGDQILLANGRGDDQGFNYFNTRFDDQAALPISNLSSLNGANGSFRPEQTLASINGLPAAGTYTLRIQDTTAGNVGDIGLLFWQLQLTRAVSDNAIQGNMIGVNAAGTAAVGNGGQGIELAGATGTLVGGFADEARNIVSGNFSDGVLINGSTNVATTNILVNNFIGLNQAGTGALANAGDGVKILGGNANFNQVVNNVISGNNNDGVDVEGLSNTIASNIIGGNASGSAAVGNGMDGVRIQGRRQTVAQNVIVGNQNGISAPSVAGLVRNLNFSSNDTPLDLNTDVNGGGSDTDPANVTFSTLDVFEPSLANDFNLAIQINHTFISDLRITLIDPSGQRILLMERRGGDAVNMNLTFDDQAATSITTANPGPVALTGSFQPESPLSVLTGRSLLGTYTLEIVDLIPQNPDNPMTDPPNRLVTWSIRAQASGANHAITDNKIGVNNSLGATTALPNANHGIFIQGVGENLILGNVVSSNAGNGILITNAGGIGGRDFITANRIGVGVSENTAFANGLDGLRLDQSPGSTIDSNLIAGNAGNGIRLAGPLNNSLGGLIINNEIGSAQAPNGANGVLITQVNNVDLNGNTIASNVLNGIATQNSTGVVVLNGSIHDNGRLPLDVGNNGSTAGDRANSPLILNATFDSSSGLTLFQGTFRGLPNRQYLLQIYANNLPTPSFFGDGNEFVGSTLITTNGAGNGVINLSLDTSGVTSGPFYSATLTAQTATGSTTEFSLVYPTADLSATIPTLATPLLLGVNSTYAVNIQNNGPGPAFNTIVTIPIPLGLDFVSVDRPFAQTVDPVTNQTIVTVNLGTVANAANIPLTVTVFPRSPQTYFPTASVVSGTPTTAPTNPAFLLYTPDVNTANNSTTGSLPTNSRADLAVDFPNLPSELFSGRNVYTIRVRNLGLGAAASVYLYHKIPAEVALTPSKIRVLNPDGSVNPNVVTSIDNGNLVALLSFLAANDGFIIEVDAEVSVTTPDSAIEFNAFTILNDQDDNVGPPVNNNIAKASVTGRGPTGTFQFAATSLTTVENTAGGLVNATITRTGGSRGRALIDVKVLLGGTATLNTDFALASAQVVFEDGELTKPVVIQLTNDMIIESNETVRLEISSALATIGSSKNFTLTIQDDDRPTPAGGAVTVTSPAVGDSTVPITSGRSTTTTQKRANELNGRVSPFAGNKQANTSTKKGTKLKAVKKTPKAAFNRRPTA